MTASPATARRCGPPRQLVRDLALWRAGTIGWHDLSRSLLVYGPPGTGKTWLARAIGNDANLSVITGSFAQWQAEGHLGDMLRAMRRSFAEARKGQLGHVDKWRSQRRIDVMSMKPRKLSAVLS